MVHPHAAGIDIGGSEFAWTNIASFLGHSQRVTLPCFRMIAGLAPQSVGRLTVVVTSLLSGYKLNRFSWLEGQGKSSWESIC